MELPRPSQDATTSIELSRGSKSSPAKTKIATSKAISSHISSKSSTSPLEDMQVSHRLVLPSNIVGLTILGNTADKVCVNCDLPPLPTHYTPRQDIYRDKTNKHAAKGTLKPSNVVLFDLNNYIGFYIDPGTSSMALRITRRQGGKTVERLHWETQDFRVDSTLIKSVQDHINGLLDKYKVDVLVEEIQLSKFGMEYTQHIILNCAIARGIPVVTLQPATRYRALGLGSKINKENKAKIYDLALDILTEECDVAGLEKIDSVKGITSKNNTKVSAQKRRDDLLTTVTLEVCAEGLLVQAAMETLASITEKRVEDLKI